MSAQDKVERVLREIHLLFSQSPEASGEPEKIIVKKQEVFALLERLTLSMYEVMDSYEATQQSKELAKRRFEKQGQELVNKATRQAEDVYAASLLYTEDALCRMQKVMSEAAENTKRIMVQMETGLEKESARMKSDKDELMEQLKDFKDSNKYMVLMEGCNRDREKEDLVKQGKDASKKIHNEPKHYAMNIVPEIKVNPAYFQRKGVEMPSGAPHPQEETAIKPEPQETEDKAIADQKIAFPETVPQELGEELVPFEEKLKKEKTTCPGISIKTDNIPEFMDEELPRVQQADIKVDLDAEYFRWQAQKGEPENEDKPSEEKKERRFLFGKYKNSDG